MDNHDQGCRLCGNEITGKYCAHCGSPETLRRINGHYIASEIASVLNLKKGFLYTVRELLIRPGKSVRKYIRQDRQSLLKPISFLIISSLIYTLLEHWLSFEDGYISFSEQELADSALGAIMVWIPSNYGFANILMAVFIAFWLKLFFRKYEYNIYEIMILLCYVMGILMIVFAVLGSVEAVINVKIMGKASIVVVGYLCWSIARFFDGKKKRNYVKAVLGYFLGMVLFFFVVTAIGLTIDLEVIKTFFNSKKKLRYL
jgi:hypothetical protein